MQNGIQCNKEIDCLLSSRSHHHRFLPSTTTILNNNIRWTVPSPAAINQGGAVSGSGGVEVGGRGENTIGDNGEGIHRKGEGAYKEGDGDVAVGVVFKSEEEGRRAYVRYGLVEVAMGGWGLLNVQKKEKAMRFRMEEE
ncbi:hypothetical protein RIF29_18937 [Crotalaria pallida]|uniref:Uncharacterized protein n=1 Tax=Crotalaria pallida TaxID=3830 RepID=A0AAN9EYK8_CROPI